MEEKIKKKKEEIKQIKNDFEKRKIQFDGSRIETKEEKNERLEKEYEEEENRMEEKYERKKKEFEDKMEKENLCPKEYKGIINGKEMRQLNKWTNKKCEKIIFDSDKDDWSNTTSVFGDKVDGKSNLIFVIEDTNGNKFGGYTTSTVKPIDSYISDSNAFIFSLKSNGRISGMKKFDIKSNGISTAIACDRKTNNYYLFAFGSRTDIEIKRKGVNGSFCCQSYFNYEGVSCSLCSSSNSDQQYFTPKRITVIQMK